MRTVLQNQWPPVLRFAIRTKQFFQVGKGSVYVNIVSSHRRRIFLDGALISHLGKEILTIVTAGSDVEMALVYIEDLKKRFALEASLVSV